MRPKKIRFINFDPQITYFKPQGIPLSSLEENILAVDELEALRLKNYKLFGQTECAKKMKVSQSTFQRILCTANQKVTDALINGKAIRINGGVIKMNRKNSLISKNKNMRKFKCEKCRHEWEEKFGTGERGADMSCPKCGSGEIHRTDQDGHGFGKQPWGFKEKK